MPVITERDKRGRPKYGCPSVTQVIDLLAKPALITWSYKRGLDGLDLYETRDKAADAGTHAHAMIECHLKGLPEPDADGISPELLAKAEGCYIAFLEWTRTHEFKPVESELMLVSEKHGFGGTLDIASVIGDLIICDIKTSRGVYLAHKIQVAAYGLLWNEEYPERPICGYRILRLGPEGDFSDHYMPNLDAELKMFLHLLEIKKLLVETGQKL